MVLVKVKTTREVELTAENEAEILDAEYRRRYGDAKFDVGDDVQFVANGRPKQQEYMGPDHLGRLGIVVGIGLEESIRVLAVGVEGRFVEVWTYEKCLEKLGGEA